MKKTGKDYAVGDANQGEKMIEIKVRLWTNNLAEGKGKILPKHAWTSGVVRLEPNKSHKIKPLNPKPFNSLMDLPAAIEKTLLAHGITLHPSNAMKKYIAKK